MKYTKLERNWVMYDVGNSALVLLNTSVVPIYFNAINTGASSADLVVAWGNAQTIASLVIAMLMPILGALADYAGNKIKFFLGFFLTGLVLCLAQAIPMSAMAFLTVYVLCTIGLNSSMTFYDAMLPDITTDERMDAVSSSGYAWGYIGSTVPFVICLALIMGGPALGVPTMLATRLSFIITGAWWLIFTLPLIRTYKQKYGRERGPEDTIGHIVGGVFSEVGHTMREIAHNRPCWSTWSRSSSTSTVCTRSFPWPPVTDRLWASIRRSWCLRCSLRSSWPFRPPSSTASSPAAWARST